MSDLIDRQQAIDAVEQWGDNHTWDDWCNEHKDEKERFHIVPPSDYIRSLPSVQPKKGKWVKQIDKSINAWWYECSVCGDYPLKDAFGHDCLSQFCPWCGAEMSEGEEDE